MSEKHMDLVLTSRSHIETYEKCPRKRWWQFEYDGIGLEPSDERGLKLDARIGTGVHDGIEFAIRPMVEPIADYRPLAALAAGFAAGKFMKDIADDGIEWANLPEQQQTEVREGADIVMALVYAWVRVRLPSLLNEGQVLAVEREMNVDFEVNGDRVRLMVRADIVWRRKSDGSVFIRNFKTVREARSTWREQWVLDMQTLTEPLAVDEWLGHQNDLVGGPAATCAGVIIDGLTTGAVLDYPRGSGKFYHNTPLLWAWVRKGDAPFAQDEWYPKYEWSCLGAHKMANGRRCEGGKVHKLAGARKEPTRTYPGPGAGRQNDPSGSAAATGIIGWIDHLLEEDESVVQDQIIELPPIMRAPYAIERWKRQVLAREVRIHQDARLLQIMGMSNIDPPSEPGDPATFDMTLDKHFPMHTASGNCLRPGKCVAYDLCWGTAASSPYEANYRKRRPHHQQEQGEESP